MKWKAQSSVVQQVASTQSPHHATCLIWSRPSRQMLPNAITKGSLTSRGRGRSESVAFLAVRVGVGVDRFFLKLMSDSESIKFTDSVRLLVSFDSRFTESVMLITEGIFHIQISSVDWLDDEHRTQTCAALHIVEMAIVRNSGAGADWSRCPKCGVFFLVPT